jgi:hypothetical protein
MSNWLGLGLGLRCDSRPGRGGIPITANLKAWWRPNSQTVTLNAGDLSAVADLSGNSVSLVQATGSLQPPYNTSDAAFAGYPSITVTSGKQLTATLSVTQPNTVYVVGRQAISGGAQIFDGAVSRQSFGMNGSGYYLYAGTLYNFTGMARDANAHAFCGIFNGASSVFYIDSSATGQACDLGTNALTNPVISAFPGAGADVEVAIFSGAHTQAQVKQMFAAYALYGITVS